MKKNIMIIVSAIVTVFTFVIGNVKPIKAEAYRDSRLILANSVSDIVAACKNMSYHDTLFVCYEGEEWAEYACIDSKLTINNDELRSVWTKCTGFVPSWYGTDIGWVVAETTHASCELADMLQYR